MDYLNITLNATDLFSDFDLPNASIRSISATTTAQHEVAFSLRQTRFAVQTVLTPLVVIVGLLGNILNILVLLQPSMRSSTNVYILVLSFADSIYLVFNFALSILDCRKRGLSESAYHFNPYGRFVSNFSGNVAVWVTVGFTVERYIAVCHPMHGKRWCTVSRAKLASLSIVLLTLINTLPTIFELEVTYTDEDGPRCQYTSFANQFSYEMGYSWWYVTVFTFIPLISLAIFNIVLIRVLLVASRKRQLLVNISSSVKNKSKSTDHSTNNNKRKDKNQLLSCNGTQPNGKYPIRDGSRKNSEFSASDTEYIPASQPCMDPSGGWHQQGELDTTREHRKKELGSVGNLRKESGGSQKSSVNGESTMKRQGKRMSREQNKVTLLLVTIVMIFFLCQLPWTALFLYKTYLSNNNLRGNGNHIKIAGNICNLLGLINASGNFYLYSCFSKRFRKTFKWLVLFWRRKSNLFPSMV